MQPTGFRRIHIKTSSSFGAVHVLVSIWKWLYRLVVGVGVLFLLLSVLLVFGMNQPHVTQSNGETDVSVDSNAATISGSLPPNATRVQYCRASVGMGGRLLLYRFSAPAADLHKHAQTEFAAHWHKPRFKKTIGVPSPITEHEINFYKNGFGVNAEWMLAPPEVVGTLYESSDGQFSHRPKIFVDEANDVLYFQMTD